MRRAFALLGLCLGVGCRREIPRLPTEAHLAAARLAVLADEASADFAVGGLVNEWAAAPAGPGRVAFLDDDGNRVMVVDTTGRVVATFGRKGGGPGELSNPQYLVRTDSGLAVYDGLKFALVRFDLDGRPQPDVPQSTAIGAPEGQLTGIAPLAGGAWAYSVVEREGNKVREALYVRSQGVTRLLASSPEADLEMVRLPCGVSIYAGAPVFWPTLRWAATPTRLAYAATAEDRVVVLDVGTGDSVIVTGNARPPRASHAAALAVTHGYKVTTPAKQCEIEAEQVLEQRGMMKTMPVVAALALSPDGVLWVRLSAPPGEPSLTRVHGPNATDTLVGGAFPGFFVSPTRFVAEEKDSAGNATATLWEVRPR